MDLLLRLLHLQISLWVDSSHHRPKKQYTLHLLQVLCLDIGFEVPQSIAFREREHTQQTKHPDTQTNHIRRVLSYQ